MSISDILELEHENQQIILHKEGLFIRVYERSAYLFVKHIKPYSITKKFYKNVKQEVVYLGFPQSSFSKIESICKEQNLNVSVGNLSADKAGNQIKITGFTNFSKEAFINWKQEISISESEGVAQSPRPHSLKDEIIEKLRNFQTINKTPIECQQFIVELQNELNG